ncbi:MAG: hypothetical protein QNJ40_03015 [Xanthomonadales bacterium]|nr:hypothetical protein [Xanthomonadales bacterium]
MKLLLAAAWLAGTAWAQPDPQAFDTGRDNHAGLTFSPDGQSAYWVAWDGKWGSRAAGPRTIYTAQRTASGWSPPRPAAFSGSYSDGAPFVSPDGHWLYFVSDRPETAGEDAGDGNIWRYRLHSDLHSEGALEKLAINSAAAEYSPVVVASGVLYFASARPGGLGQGDLYRAAPEGDGFQQPENLGPAVNTATGEWNLWVSPDESEMIFEASSRPTNLSVPGDLYYSRQNNGGWHPAVPLTSLNTTHSDLLTRMHPDGVTLYFTQAPLGQHAELIRVSWREHRPVSTNP